MSVGTSIGDASFRGTSSSTSLSFVIIVAITFLVVTTVVLSGTPFGKAFALLLGGVVFALADNLDAAILDVVFFVGEIAVVVEDFALVTRDFVAVAAAGADARPVFGTVVDDVPPVVLRPRDIRLLAVSLICLSIIGDFTVLLLARFSRVLAAPLEAGAVLGLDMLLLTPLVVAGFGDEVVAVLVAGEADMGRGFDVVDNGVLVIADDGLASVVVFVAPLLPVVLLLVVDLAVVSLLLATCFVSPFAVVGFLSDMPLVVLGFCEVAEAVAVTFGFVAEELSREDIVVFVVAVVAVLAAVVVFVVVLLFAVGLLFAVVLETAALADPSSCLGRAAAGFFVATDCVALVPRVLTVLATLVGEVGVDFVDAAFVVDVLIFVVVEGVFIRRFVVVEVVFDLVVELVMIPTANAKAVAVFAASESSASIINLLDFTAAIDSATASSSSSSSSDLSVGNSMAFSLSVSLLIGTPSTSSLFSFSWAGTLLGTKVSVGALSSRSNWVISLSLCSCSSRSPANTLDRATYLSDITSTFVSAASSLLDIDSL